MRFRSHNALLVGLAFGMVAALLGCSLFGVTDDSKTASDDDGEISRLEHLVDSLSARFQSQLEALRQQDFIRPVTSSVLTREQYRSMVAADIGEALSDSLSQEITLELAQWGYYLNTQNTYKQDYTQFVGGFAVGFYIGGSDSLFVMAEALDKPDNYLGLIPHELAHALQDQYGRLARPRLADSALQFYRDDARWYHTTLIEGEAHFLTALTAATYTYPQPDPLDNAMTVVRNYRTEALAAWKKTQRPNNLYLPSHSPYQFGPVLVGEAYLAKGWDSVETLFAQAAQPSRSGITRTAQAFSPVDMGTMVSVIDTSRGYHDIGSHGSLGLLALVNNQLNETDFYQGLQWVGDAYAYAHHPGQSWGRLAWMGRFETPVAAARFAELLLPLLQKRFLDRDYPGTVVTEYRDSLASELPGWYLNGAGLHTYLMINGKELYWLEGIGLSEVEAIVRNLKEQSNHSENLARQGQKGVLNRFGIGKGRIYEKTFLSCTHGN